jgi:hypothetical protein
MSQDTAEQDKFCNGCGGADWDMGEVVNGIYVHYKERMERLDMEKLPWCMYAGFLARMTSGLPDRAVVVEHVEKGNRHHTVVGRSYLGALMAGDVCSGKK